MQQAGNFPPWLRKRLYATSDFFSTKQALKRHAVNTVCESSRCPNLNECFSKHFATFLILGDSCTRGCGFCSCQRSAAPAPVIADEPQRIACAVRELDLRYVVVTSVTRDDMPDGGASVYAITVEAIREVAGDITVELLIPDLKGDKSSIETVCRAKPQVLGHNIETVKRLYGYARNGSDYDRSLDLLKTVKNLDGSIITKSSIMLGLGETEDEVLRAMRDLRDAGCDILAVGQYLRPTPMNLPVERFAPPEEFERYRQSALKLGFRSVASGPFVRSSYLAGEVYSECEAAQSKEKADDRSEVAAAG